MKKVSVVCVMIMMASLYTSCKKDESAMRLAPVDIVKSDINKVTPLLMEAVELFNSGNAITASTKADQARQVLNMVLIPGRSVTVSEKCPLKVIAKDDSMILLGISCDGFASKQPANAAGVFNKDLFLFVVTYTLAGDGHRDLITDKATADRITSAAPGSAFTADLQITDPGYLMEPEAGILSSYSMCYNVKIVDLQVAEKK